MNSDRVCREWHEHTCPKCESKYKVSGTIDDCRTDGFPNWLCENCLNEGRIKMAHLAVDHLNTADDVLSHKHVCKECQAVFETPGTCSLVHPRVCSPCAEHEHHFEYKVGIDPIGRTEYVHVACTAGDCRESFQPDSLDFTGELPDRLRS